MEGFKLWSLIVISAYVVWLIIIIIRSILKPERDITKFFLSDKKIEKIPALLTIFATFFSAGILVGGAGYFYTYGIGTWIFASLSYILMGILIITVGRILWYRASIKGKTVSPIRLILEPFNSLLLERIASGVTFVFLIPYLALQITGLSKLLDASFGLPYYASAFISVFLIYAYSESGGLKNVIKTDKIQAICTIVGLGLVAATILGKYRFNPKDFIQTIKESGHSDLLTIPGPDSFFTMPTMLTFALMFAAVIFTQPQMAKRFMIIEKKSSLNTIALLFPIMGIFLITTTGIMALGGVIEFPGLESADAVVGRMLEIAIGPIGAIALLGVIAATMSTADSLLLSFGSVITEETAQAQSDRAPRIRAGRYFTFVIAVFAFIASINPPNLVVQLVVLSFGGTFQLAPVYLAGIFKKPCHPIPAILSILCGVGTLVVFQYFVLPESRLGLPPALWGFMVSSSIVIISILFKEISKYRKQYA